MWSSSPTWALPAARPRSGRSLTTIRSRPHTHPSSRDSQLTLAARLPPFPWDLLAPYREKARAHRDGIVDLSIGTPVDPVPPSVRAALAGAPDAPGYPPTQGTDRLRDPPPPALPPP